jgi:hypothetical protein
LKTNLINLRFDDFERVKSIKSRDPSVCDLTDFEDSFLEHEENDFPEFDEESRGDSQVRRLTKEVLKLRNELKTLKKMAVLNFFGSKEEFVEFFNDIW